MGLGFPCKKSCPRSAATVVRYDFVTTDAAFRARVYPLVAVPTGRHRLAAEQPVTFAAGYARHGAARCSFFEERGLLIFYSRTQVNDGEPPRYAESCVSRMSVRRQLFQNRFV